MNILEKIREKFVGICRKENVNTNIPVSIRPLHPDEAIGRDADRDYALKKGVEHIVEANFDSYRGQAFTQHPDSFQGPLEEVIQLDLSKERNRALFVAALNAVLRSLYFAEGTIHCHDCVPKECGPEVARQLKERFGATRYGQIGYQPDILENMVKTMGADNIRVVDLNPDIIGTTKFGVPIWDGNTEFYNLLDWCAVGLVSGSTVVNGTIDEIAKSFHEQNKPVIYYGNTIAGPAVLQDLDRICPFGE